MAVKVKELADIRTAKSGCQRPCCKKDPKQVPLDRVWRFSLANPDTPVFK